MMASQAKHRQDARPFQSMMMSSSSSRIFIRFVMNFSSLRMLCRISRSSDQRVSTDALFGIVTCNSRFAVAEQVCAWQAPLPPPAPPAALPEWELTCGGSVQRSITLFIFVQRR